MILEFKKKLKYLGIYSVSGSGADCKSAVLMTLVVQLHLSPFKIIKGRLMFKMNDFITMKCDHCKQYETLVSRDHIQKYWDDVCPECNNKLVTEKDKQIFLRLLKLHNICKNLGFHFIHEKLAKIFKLKSYRINVQQKNGKMKITKMGR